MSVWRMPIIWLFMGPPIFRMEVREATASLQGELDVWNAFRMVWWLGFGLFAVLEIYQHRAHLPAFVRRAWVMLASACTLLFALFLSTLFSPSPIFTVGNALLMTMAFLGTVDLGIKLEARLVTSRQILHACFVVALLLLGIVVALVVVPLLLAGGFSGQRIRGDNIGGTHILSLVIFFTGVALGISSRGRWVAWYWVGAALGIAFLLLSQTRTAYVGFVIGLVVFLALGFVRAGLRQRAVMVAAAALASAGVLGVLLRDELSPSGEALPSRALAYLIRSESSLANASGRDGIFSILVRETAAHPFGLGYAAGPRVVLLSQEHEAELFYHHGVLPGRIGNAHNAYLEVFAGAGFLASLAHLVLIGWAMHGLWRRRGPTYLAAKSLLLVVLIEGLTGSAGMLPLNQVSVMFWILAGLATASRASDELGAGVGPGAVHGSSIASWPAAYAARAGGGPGLRREAIR
jgi:O-antigen ligase